MRLFDSLIRLSQAHARLVFRSTVTAVDAVTVVRLMESSWGFGKFISPENILKAELPLGPSNENIKEIMTIFNLCGTAHSEQSVLHDTQLNTTNKENVPEVVIVPDISTTFLQSSQILKDLTSIDAENIDDILALDFELPKLQNIDKNVQNKISSDKRKRKSHSRKPAIEDSIHNVPNFIDNDFNFDDYMFKKKKVQRETYQSQQMSGVNNPLNEMRPSLSTTTSKQINEESTSNSKICSQTEFQSPNDDTHNLLPLTVTNTIPTSDLMDLLSQEDDDLFSQIHDDILTNTNIPSSVPVRSISPKPSRETSSIIKPPRVCTQTKNKLNLFVNHNYTEVVQNIEAVCNTTNTPNNVIILIF